MSWFRRRIIMAAIAAMSYFSAWFRSTGWFRSEAW